MRGHWAKRIALPVREFLKASLSFTTAFSNLLGGGRLAMENYRILSFC